MSKITPGKPVGGTQFGTTFHDAKTHAPTLKGSSTSPKSKIATNGIMSGEPHGTTFQSAGKQPFSTPDADKSPSTSKVKKSGSSAGFVPNGKGIKYGDGGNGPSVKNPTVKKR